MANRAFTVTISGTAWPTYVNEADAVVLAAINNDITTTLDFNTPDGHNAIVRTSEFMDSQAPDFGFDLTEADLTDDQTRIVNQLKVACVREAMARSVANAQPIQRVSSVTAGEATTDFQSSYRSLITGAADRGFYDQVAFNIMAPYLGTPQFPVGVAGTAIPDATEVTPTFANYLDG